MNEATYCPEDNKLRLYVGRVPREEYLALKAEGWTSTPKQGCDFVATWTPEREDTALDYAGEIGDEDQSPADRAADRAERFAGYREKRTWEALQLAGRYESGPEVHGYQSTALAERRAAQHDRTGGRAVTQWNKAEYWQHRTEGVIGHALHVSSPGVRMGRIKELETLIRKREADGLKATTENQETWDIWQSLTTEKPIILKACLYSLHNAEIKPGGEDGKYTTEQGRLGMALMLVDHVHTEYGSDRHKLQKKTIQDLKEGTLSPKDAAALWIANHPERPADYVPGGRWYDHYKLRLAYEMQMLEAQGGRAAFVEMEAGGWIGSRQIQKVNKSPATGRVVSVQVWGTCNRYNPALRISEQKECLVTVETERLQADIYRAPTDEERAAFVEAKKEAKKAKAATTPKAPPLVNLTDEDAERLQAVWIAENGRYFEHVGRDEEKKKVLRMTQAEYSARSKGSYSHCEAKAVRGGGSAEKVEYFGAVAKVRCNYKQLIILTDKPQKPAPAGFWDDKLPALYAKTAAEIAEINDFVRTCGGWAPTPPASTNQNPEKAAENWALWNAACVCGLVYSSSRSQFGLTEKGWAVLREKEQAKQQEPRSVGQLELIAI